MHLNKLIFLFFALILFFGNSIAAQLILPNPLCPDSQPNCLTFASLINNIISYILGIIGAIAALMFVWAGILFVTSAGDQSKITRARQAMFYAAIGLGIAIAGNGLIQLIYFIIKG